MARARPVIDPTDLLMLQHPTLRHLPCIAIQGCSCAESVIRLAISVVTYGDADLSKFDIMKTAPPLLTACTEATLPQMQRRLQHYPGAVLRDFPVYIPTPGQETEYVLAYPTCKPRKDQWCILYVAPFPGSAGQAHWTFTSLVAPQVRRRDENMIVHSKAPIFSQVEGVPRVFWRARVTPENFEVFMACKAQGIACDCPWQMRCPHERVVGRCRRVAFGGDEIPSGGYVAQLVKSVRTPRLSLLCGPSQRVDAEVPNGGLLQLNHAWGTAVMPTERLECISVVSDVRVGEFEFTLAQYAQQRPAFPIASVVKSTLALCCAWWVDVELDGSWPTYVYVVFCAYLLWKAVMPCMKRLATIATSNDDIDWITVSPTPIKKAYGATAPLSIHSDTLAQVTSRLALRDRTEDVVKDALRRAFAETKWAQQVVPTEVEAYCELVWTTPGTMAQMPAVPVGCCINCLRRTTTYRRECRQCKQARRRVPPIVPFQTHFLQRIGKVGIWSRAFTLPAFMLKQECTITHAGRRLFYNVNSTLGQQQAIASILAFLDEKYPAELSCRGHNAGPMIMGAIPQCFPHGYGTAVKAFMVRLGAARPKQAYQREHRQEVEALWTLFGAYISRSVHPLEEEDRAEFLSHFTGDKLVKMQEAFREIDNGYAYEVGNVKLPHSDALLPSVQMSGFTKAEKSFSYTWADGYYEPKLTEKPRFICCPPPVFLAELGPFTHAQLKWLSRSFTSQDHLFYAGCANPGQMNDWLNMTLRELSDSISLVDDITAIDANHSGESFAAHARLRARQFPHMSYRHARMFAAEETLLIRIGPFSLAVADVNGSGVGDTSYKNGVICLVIRLLAITYAVTYQFELMTTENQLAVACDVASQIWTSAAGDDGLTRLPAHINGVDVHSPGFLQRYMEYWALAGFEVKAQVIPAHRWRMATYLAMRPVWAGERYEWAPEPARRLKSLFWQIDNAMHPVAWARGVATQVLAMSRHAPVLSDICEWFLANTKGPATGAVQRPYSPWDGYTTSGVRNERALCEFCIDYSVSREAYVSLLEMLDKTQDVYVNLCHFVLYRIVSEES